MVCSCRPGEGLLGVGSCLRRSLTYGVLNQGLALTTTSAFGVGGRTRRLVIGEILTPRVGLLTRSTLFRVRSPSVGAHHVGRTVLCSQPGLVIVAGGGRVTSCRLRSAAVTDPPATEWSQRSGSKGVWLRIMANASGCARWATATEAMVFFFPWAILRRLYALNSG